MRIFLFFCFLLSSAKPQNQLLHELPSSSSSTFKEEFRPVSTSSFTPPTSASSSFDSTDAAASASSQYPYYTPFMRAKVCAKGDAICIPSNYSKFDLPNETLTLVNVGIDIKDIPKIDDQEFSITLNAFFVVRWTDRRMIINQDKMDLMFKQNEDPDSWIPVDVSFIKEFWLPDAEILNLKEFKTLDVLSKLEGLWLNRNFEIMYAVATRITFICPMTFNSFPLDVQVTNLHKINSRHLNAVGGVIITFCIHSFILSGLSVSSRQFQL